MRLFQREQLTSGWIAIALFVLLLWSQIWEEVKCPALIIVVTKFTSALWKLWMAPGLHIFFCHGNEASKISCVTDNVLTDSLQGSDLFHWFVIQFSGYRVLLLIQNRKGYKVGGNCKQSVGRKMQIFLSVGCRSTDLLDCLGLVKVGQICWGHVRMQTKFTQIHRLGSREM